MLRPAIIVIIPNRSNNGEISREVQVASRHTLGRDNSGTHGSGEGEGLCVYTWELSGSRGTPRVDAPSFLHEH